MLINVPIEGIIDCLLNGKLPFAAIDIDAPVTLTLKFTPFTGDVVVSANRAGIVTRSLSVPVDTTSKSAAKLSYHSPSERPTSLFAVANDLIFLSRNLPPVFNDISCGCSNRAVICPNRASMFCMSQLF